MNELSAEYIKAAELDRRIKTSAQLAQQSLYDMCMGFKEMRDSRLYKELGYSEFNDYCKSETGFSDRQVYNYISIVEKLPKELVNSSSLIGVKKLTLLTKLSEDERSELTENTDLENTSVRELEEKVKQLKIKADKADMLSHRLEDMNNICDTISKQRDKADRRIRQLEAEIKELESRPIEVAVETDNKEVANLKDAMRRVDLDWSKKYSKLEEDSLKDRRELLQKAEQAEKDKQDKLSQLRAELDRTKAEYEKKLSGKADTAPVQDDKAIFKAYLSTAVDSVTRLVDFVNEHNDSDNYGLFTQKARQLADIINSKLEV
jgi:chromosome segregation ATPase